MVDKTQRGVFRRLLGGGVPGARGGGGGFIKLPLKFICSFDVLSNEELSCCFGGENKYSKNVFNTYISFLCITLQYYYFLCTILQC